METLLQQFIKAFGWSILNSLWQSAIIYGILFIVMLSIPKLAAKYKHNLAFGAIMLMFIGFSYNIIHQLTLNINDHAPAISPQNIQVYQYFNNLPPSFSSKAEQYFPIVVIFYAIGIVLQLFVIIKGYGQLSKLKKESLSTIPDSWKTIFEQVTTRLKINKVIRFHLSSIVNVPLVIGYLKPVVLFPLALVSQLDNDQVEAILIHELSHIRRNDFLLNLIKTAIETLLFYNPFVWMAGRFIHIEREHACDDLVLKITGKPLNYAHALLKLELLKDKNSPAYALAATGQTQNLYQRIKRITNMKTNYLNAKQQMAALTLGVACLFSIAWINPTEKKKENKIQPKQEILSVRSANGTISHLICTDTTKKRKIKIITIDANGNKKEYNSLKEMPDSLRKDFYRDELFGGNGIYRINLDSSFKFRLNDSLLNKKLYKEYNSPEAQAKWKKFGEDIAKQYNSPEAQAKWRKFSEEMQKKMNSPEAQAKWKKFGEDMAAKINTPEFRAQLDNIRMQVLKSGDMVNLSGLTNLQSDSIFKGNRNTLTGPDGTVFFYNDNNNTNSKVKQTEEYKKLKEKFDSEVKELKEKMEKKEKIDGGNKSSQISPAVMLYNNKNFSDPAKILKIENAVVTYKKADFKIADQLALKSFLKTDNPIAIANNNTISISIK